MKHDLPVEPSERRLYKLNWLAQFCSSFDRGCSESKLMIEALSFGNTSAKAVEYVNVIQLLGLVTKRGNKLYVDAYNYQMWAERKGFKEPDYTIKCPTCPCSYSSRFAECPTCQSPNPFLNEPSPTIHTQSNSPEYAKEEYNNRGTTEPYIDIYTEKPTPRQGRVKAGRKAEKRVIELLKNWGEARLGDGKGGRPDVFFDSPEVCFAVEVKSIQHQVKVDDDRYKASAVPLSVDQWTALCAWSDSKELVPLLVVEVKIRGSNRGHLYHAIRRDVVDARVRVAKGRNIRISVHDLAAMGETYRPGVSGDWFV